MFAYMWAASSEQALRRRAQRRLGRRAGIIQNICPVYMKKKLPYPAPRRRAQRRLGHLAVIFREQFSFCPRKYSLRDDASVLGAVVGSAPLHIVITVTYRYYRYLSLRHSLDRCVVYRSYVLFIDHTEKRLCHAAHTA